MGSSFGSDMMAAKRYGHDIDPRHQRLFKCLQHHGVPLLTGTAIQRAIPLWLTQLAGGRDGYQFALCKFLLQRPLQVATGHGEVQMRAEIGQNQ